MRNGLSAERRLDVHRFQMLEQRRALVPGRALRSCAITLSPKRAEIGIGTRLDEVRASRRRCENSATIASKTSCGESDQVDLVHRQHDMADAEQRGDIGVAPRLRQHALARVDQDDGEFGVGRAGRHVAGVLLVAGRVGDDEFALVGGEEAIGDVDGDALLALGFEPVHQQREIDIVAGGAVLLEILFERGQLIFEQQLGIVEQPADQRGLAVVDAAAGEKAQQRLLLLRGEIFGERGGAWSSEIALPLLLLHRGASRRCRSAGPGAPRCARSTFR